MGPSEGKRTRVLKSGAHGSPLLAAPQPGDFAPVPGGRFFGRQDLATRYPAEATPGGSSVSGMSRQQQEEEAREYVDLMRRRAEAVLADAEEVAGQRLAEAEERVAQLLSEAVAAGERISAEAHQSGYQEGYAEGHGAGVAQAQGLIAAAQTEAAQIRRQAEQEKAALLRQSMPEMVRLALRVAEHILHEEVRMRPEAVAGMVAAALAQFGGQQRLVLRISTADAERLEKHKAELIRRVPGLQELELLPDPALSHGDFHIHSEQGYVDGVLDEQFAIVAAALLAEEPS